MAIGRTTLKHTRFFADGIDLSGYTRSFGPLVWEYGEADLTCPPSDAAKGYLPTTPTITPTLLNAVLDNDAAGLFASARTAGVARVVLIPFGMRAAPAAGDPVFSGYYQMQAYQAQEDGGAMVVSIPWEAWDAANLLRYQRPWGWLLHTKSAETGANTGAGIDDYGAATSYGGYISYQIFTSNAAGNVTISVDDSADNAAFLALSGATSGAIANTAIPTAGLVALGTTADVRRYLRWQVALAGGMTTVTFALAFVRGLTGQGL